MICSQFRSCFNRAPQAKTAIAVVLTLLLLLPRGLVAQSSVPQPNAGSLNFLVISDWGGKGGTTQVAVAQQMGLTAAAQKSSFVITCGDNYHGNGISSADSPRWQTEYENIYNNPSLMIPWFVTLGNHDNRGKVDAEIAYSKLSSRWKLPARYYTHTEKIRGTNEALFVHLDTSPFVAAYHKTNSPYRVADQDSKAQLRWLETTLAESPARWKIVVGHHPVYAAAPGHGDTKELITDILPVLQKYGVRVYFCGHDHVLQHLVDGGVNFFVCGGGSSHRSVNQRKDVRFGADSAGFLAMTLTGAAAQATYIDDKGVELYRTSIPAP
jgi:tartrate-resistant acid phosphatase type 5